MTTSEAVSAFGRLGSEGQSRQVRLIPLPAPDSPNVRKFARLKHLVGCPGSAWNRGLALKLIKEDHFACTTKTFEILAETQPEGQAPGSDLLRPPEYTQATESSRPRGLFDYSLVKEHTGLRHTVRTFRSGDGLWP